MRTFRNMFLLALVATPAAAGDKATPPETLAKQVAPFVDEMTILVVHVDVRRLDVGPLFKLFGDLDVTDTDIKPLMDRVTKIQAELKRVGATDVFILLNWDAPRLDEDFLLVAPGARIPEKGTLDKLLPFAAMVQHDTLLLSTPRNLERMKTFKSVERAAVLKALTALDDADAKAVILPPPVLARALAEMFPKLPEPLAEAPTRELVRGFAWAGLSLQTRDKVQASFIVQASDAKMAEKYQALVKKALDIPVHDPRIQLAFPQFLKLRDALLPEVKGDQLGLNIREPLLRDGIAPLIQKMRGGAARDRSANNLKQIALAFHNYHDSKRTFPPAFTSGKGKRLLSWRVYLLPYIEQEPLFREFHLNEPWDSPHNKKLIERIPETYRSPLARDLPPGKTTYVVPTGPNTIFVGGKGMKITQIFDGTSNTILVLEANSKHAVFWTQPEDFPADQKDPLAALVNKDLKGFHAAFADGSVRWLTDTLTAPRLRALITPGGGEAIEPD